MKLLYCLKCKDIVLLYSGRGDCYCGKSTGRYLDGFNAEYSGPCLMLGIDNLSLRDAVELHKKFPNGERGIMFQAFIIPENAPTIHKTDKESKDGSTAQPLDKAPAKQP